MSSINFQAQTSPQAGAIPEWDANRGLSASYFIPDTSGGIGAGAGTGGGKGWSYPGGVLATQTSGFTLDESTYNGWYYPLDDTSGNAVQTLPSAASCPGKVVTFEKVPAAGGTVSTPFTCTITANGAEPIGNLAATTYVLRNIGDRVTLISTGSATLGWRILQQWRGYSGILFNSIAASTAVTGGTSGATTGTGAAYDQSYTIPLNVLKAGDIIRVRAMVKQTGVNSSDTMQLALLIGATTVVQTAAVAGTSASYGNILCDITVRDIGATGHIVADAVYALGAAGSTTKNLALDSTAVATTTALLISVAALYSSSNASNTSRLDRLTIERIPASANLA